MQQNKTFRSRIKFSCEIGFARIEYENKLLKHTKATLNQCQLSGQNPWKVRLLSSQISTSKFMLWASLSQRTFDSFSVGRQPLTIATFIIGNHWDDICGALIYLCLILSVTNLPTGMATIINWAKTRLESLSLKNMNLFYLTKQVDFDLLTWQPGISQILHYLCHFAYFWWLLK